MAKKTSGKPERRGRFMDRVQARLSLRRRAATGFVSQPEPRAIGSFARGRQLIAGNLLFSGYLVEAQSPDMWAIEVPNAAFEADLHGFGWLDDLAAVGDAAARRQAQSWLFGWAGRYGRGRGPGWTPDLTGRRVMRWISHALFVLRGADATRSDAFFRVLSAQTWYLSRRWHTAAPGLPRFEALTGLIYAGLSLEGMEKLAVPALQALARECDQMIDGKGAMPTRNPEDLLEVFTLLAWTEAALAETDIAVPERVAAAMNRAAPTLRMLRHHDGALGRFHGGGGGIEGRLDQALAVRPVRGLLRGGLAMGYARLSPARTSILIDAGVPPAGGNSANGHASTLAFELTSGRRPLIVSCGAGRTFGVEWRRAGRATPSHSVLCLDGMSSARLGPPDRAGTEFLVQAPRYVPVELSVEPDDMRFEGAHDGYVPSHGLTYVRKLQISDDGRSLLGEEMLLSIEPSERKRFDRAMDSSELAGIPYAVRFHLHPDVDATVDMNGTAVSLALKSGEVWVFRNETGSEIALEPSVYLDRARLQPRATKQIVLSARAMEYSTRIRWRLAKAHDAPIAVRDFDRDETFLTY